MFKVQKEFTNQDGFKAILVEYEKPQKGDPPKTLEYKGEEWHLDVESLLFGAPFEYMRIK